MKSKNVGTLVDSKDLEILFSITLFVLTLVKQ